MKEFVNGLRQICLPSEAHYSPFLLRTRFERNLYGLMATISESSFGKKIGGPTEPHLKAFLETVETRGGGKEREAMILGARLYEKFTSLSDNSNWSDDGQDPRVKSCQKDILSLCDLADDLQLAPRSAG
jgi:hypothetical protein